MSEEEKEEKKCESKIKWVDGMPCIVLPDEVIIKEKSTRHNPVHPFTFGKLQGKEIGDPFTEILKEFQNIINMPFLPGKWKFYKIKNGEIKEIKDEDEENDNAK